jgi:hypothetical protein
MLNLPEEKTLSEAARNIIGAGLTRRYVNAHCPDCLALPERGDYIYTNTSGRPAATPVPGGSVRWVAAVDDIPEPLLCSPEVEAAFYNTPQPSGISGSRLCRCVLERLFHHSMGVVRNIRIPKRPSLSGQMFSLVPMEYRADVKLAAQRACLSYSPALSIFSLAYEWDMPESEWYPYVRRYAEELGYTADRAFLHSIHSELPYVVGAQLAARHLFPSTYFKTRLR